MTAFLDLACGVLGLLVGSLAKVVVRRVPAGESLRPVRRPCPSCASEPGGFDLVPVVSWVVRRGRCRACGERIGWRDPLIEIGCAVVFAAAAARFGWAWELPAYLALFAGLVVLSAIDLEHFLLPNRVLYPTLFTVAALLAVASVVDGRGTNAWHAAVGGLAAFAVFFLINFAYPEGMAFGDVRLAGVLGMATGWLSLGHVLLAFFLAFLTSAAVGLTLILLRVRGRRDPIPFGPFLALGAALTVLVGQPMLNVYLHK
jgi:leader peptidase (prepilin peptidase)/N-methyltransferase